ncbi:ABC transporter substrate-binding protein [Pseudomonas sp. CDFA 602]|uniref:ABC transporter substrate-binding protein n=1 Tax=Pseudomonas californiensis TaxID=2829823 RepID=UPI001E3041A3|nr:ABC transporter substrate-binding protein [Pseudomonas californiensis]MCD5993516.1 ABC transporter substrate-binding protein [Pseudomonas californiensis]MCD5999111.1 ABC transporter substrate-binding protein [Pseudomonas californiensis]
MKKSLIGLLFLASPLLSWGASEELRFGVDPTYPPFESKRPDGSLTGFDIELGESLCVELKRRCIWVENAFDGMVSALKGKKFDGILSALSITEARKAEIAFSDTLYDTPARLVAPEGSPLQPTAESLRGKRIGVQQGSVFEVYAKRMWGLKGAEIVPYQSSDLTYSDLINGRLDAAFDDAIAVSEGLLKKPMGKGFAYVGEVVKSPEIFGPGTGIGLRKNDTELAKDINKALERLHQNGTYQRIASKYFDFDISPNVAP